MANSQMQGRYSNGMTTLVPERRLDRNNKMVTRWVKPNQANSSNCQLPCPAASPHDSFRPMAVDELYNFAFVKVNGQICDIYEMEMPDPDEVYSSFQKGLDLLSEEALLSLSNAAHKADSYLAKEFVADIVYRLRDCSDDERQLFSLLALHSDDFVELLDTKFKHVHDTEVMQWTKITVKDAIARPIDGLSIEKHSEAALTLGLLFPYDYFQDNPRIVKTMVNDRDAILEHHDLVVRSDNHVRGRKELDLGILLDMEEHFSAIRVGAL